MKLLGSILALAGIIMVFIMIWVGVRAHYEYETQFENMWSLSEKSSTISLKSEYMDKFVNALDKSGLQGCHNALMYYTPDNSFDENMKTLRSLQTRLQDIKGLDENSFAYQTAIQQITAQEQGEAQPMLDVLGGCWMKTHHYWLWNGWISFSYVIVAVILIVIGSAMLFSSNDYY